MGIMTWFKGDGGRDGGELVSWCAGGSRRRR
jgi:hypothetical protein